MDVVRTKATVDWDRKEQARASVRRHIRRILAKYRHSPDRQETVVHLVMLQSELMAAGVAP
ncbi:hypothetical protein FEAC_15190 [Ferrimicrobium acidiphilum DSM 19497]|uniref:Type I restriction enzyme HindI endonuclease subunit-like C-terminal domain-containing protein n=1 Tax=Ferrimicrobium acidiphilum DSM 19497 TaxID=1121877 RepID=A0A0D8FWV8_9ACTN|nr:type I restriction enzyme endonuclease domain-containing protein [Ferrimicrobium sp.]KJE76732.1 hypothetical protein FEAC_15190 [Ferrimicrobium acidiphilum DSM 19497]